MPGDEIYKVAELALSIARYTGRNVDFTFNDVDLTVEPTGTNVGEITHKFFKICEERSKKYREAHA